MPSAVNASTMDRNGKPSMIMIPAKSYEQPSLAYIDLDLPKDDEVFTPPSRSTAALKKARELIRILKNSSKSSTYQKCKQTFCAALF